MKSRNMYEYLGVCTTILFLISAILNAIAFSIHPENGHIIVTALCFLAATVLRIPDTIDDIQIIKHNRKSK